MSKKIEKNFLKTMQEVLQFIFEYKYRFCFSSRISTKSKTIKVDQ